MLADIRGWIVQYGKPGSGDCYFSPGCFHESDKTLVPLMDQTATFFHDPSHVIGYAELEERENGIYCNCFFNNSRQAKAFIRRMRLFSKPKSFSFSAYKVKIRKLRMRQKIVNGVIRSLGLEYSENPGSSIEQINITKKEKVKNVDTGTEGNLEAAT